MSLQSPRSPGKLQRSQSAYAHTAHTRPGVAIDPQRWFICPTLTPLFYTAVYQQLTEAQQRRYNQLTGMAFNELIASLEQIFSQTVGSLIPRERVHNSDLAQCMAQFIDDEKNHIASWRELNLLTEPDRYRHDVTPITRTSPRLLKAVSHVTARPRLFPGVLWLIMILEEHSVAISRKCLHMDRTLAEPTYREAYHAHAVDEIRHVQLDWHLIDRYYAPLPRWWRAANARLVAWLIGECFLPPVRSAMRVVEALITEDPQLAPLEAAMRRQLRELVHNEGYLAMMYSRATTPITFSQFDRYPEMHRMRYVLRTYTPQPCTPQPSNPEASHR